MRLPTIIASSVVRSTQQGESHGGVYLVDFEEAKSQQVIDWNDPGIDWQGRGSDRGLRGIALYREKVYLAASDELFVYDRNFRLLTSFRNPYLKHCHEICLEDDVLYLTSTGFNAVLEFDLNGSEFTVAHQLSQRGWLGRLAGAPYTLNSFDPREKNLAPRERLNSSLHINNVSRFAGSTFVSGTKFNELVELRHGRARPFCSLPRGTHNAMRTDREVVYNDTARGCVVLQEIAGSCVRRFQVPVYPPEQLTHTDLPQDHARQGFARGLVRTGDLIVGGSSPSTISVYSLSENKLVRSVNLSRDIRNCIHGLEVWQ